MTVYSDAHTLNKALQTLFAKVGQDPRAAQAVSDSRLILRLRITAPEANVIVNGRKRPPEITYGETSLRPDLEIELNASALHRILLGELRLSSAIAGRQLVVRGPIFRTFVFEEIFHSAQRFYPGVLAEMGLDGSAK